MRITERQLRRIIREILLNEGFSITNAPREPLAPGEPILNYATSKGIEDYRYDPPSDTKHTHKMKSNYIPDKQLSSWYKVHWEGVSTLVSEILRWNPRLEKSVYMYRDRSLIGYTSPSPVEADKKRTGAVGILLTGGHVTQVFSSDAQTQYIKTASGWRYYSQFQIDRGIDSRPLEKRLDPRGGWEDRAYTGKPWTVTPEDVPVGVVPEGTVVGAIPTAIVVTCLEPFTKPATPQYDKLLEDLELLDLPILNELLEPVTIGYLRQLIDASRNPDSNLTPPTSPTRPQRIGGFARYRGKNENDKVPTFVDDDFVVRNDPITQLPDGFHVTRTLIAGYPLESLPRGLRVDGDLMIESPFITALPDDAVVGKDLYMGESMTTLPNNLHIKGALRANVANFQFPKGLKVDGNLFVAHGAVMPPDDLQVGGKVYGYNGAYKEQAKLAAPHLKDKIG
jgi:hypothetical protein